jgi:transcriptional regulator with XRE-family HTH domain
MRNAVTSEQWRELVGVKVQRRRLDLGYGRMSHAAEAAGISNGTWAQIESGRRSVSAEYVTIPSLSEATQVLVGRCLGWDDGWLARLLAGDEPEVVDPAAGPTPHATLDDVAVAVSQMAVALASAVEQIESLTQQVRKLREGL